MKADLPTTAKAQSHLELLYSISRELAVQLDLRQLLQRVLQLTLEHIGGQSGSILVLDEEGQVIEGALAYGGKVHDHSAEQLTYTYERGLAGWVVEHKEGVLVSNTQDDERWVDRPGEGGSEARSAISVPLISRDRVVGVLTTSHPVADQLTPDDQALLSAIAEQAGIAVENARLFLAEQERRQFASTLQEIARTISSTLDPEQVFRQVLEQLERVISFDSASIFLVEDDHLRLVSSHGFADENEAAGLRLPLDDNLMDVDMLRTGKAMVRDDVQKEAGWLKTNNLPESRQIHGWIGAPLVVRDQVVGVLNVDSHEIGTYGQREVDVVTAFADQAATAVLNAQLYAESQRQVRATQALAETARVVTASLDLQDVPQRILSQTMQSLEAEGASLALLNPESNELEFQLATGVGAEKVTGFSLDPGQGIAGWVLKNKEPVAIEDVTKDDRFFSGVDEKTGMQTRNVICVPIILQGKVIGVLEAINLPAEIVSEEQIQLMNGIAGLAGTALSHAQLFSETQSARERYAGLFNDSIDPILITNLNGSITEANQRAETFLGYPRQHLMDRSMLALHKEYPAQLPRDLSDLDSGETVSYDAKLVHQSGRELPVEVHVKRIDIDGQPFLQWISHDISERLELDELRADLTSMIFHDLRSPLGNVMSSLEMLEESIPDDNEMLQSIVSIANRSSRRLSRLVESLLDLGQLEADQAVLHIEEASLVEIIGEATEEVEPLADAKDHELTVSLQQPLPTVEIDVDMIRRVIINLHANAIKYTRSGGKIAVTARHEASEVFVSVQDNGPGISAQNQHRLFAKFSRIHHEGRPKGLGLGLAFCRLAVDAHGGEIWLDSEEGEGSTFTFRLPFDVSK